MVSIPPVPPDRADDLEDPTGIRSLLSNLPDPGPMPLDLVERISASIAAEQAARGGAGTVVPLRPRRWRRIGLIAAAAAAVAVGVPALMTGTSPGDVMAFLGGSSSSSSVASGSASPLGADATRRADSLAQAGGSRATAPAGAYTLSASGTAYTSASLAQQVQLLSPGAGTAKSAPAPMAATAGSAETAAGLAACLRALGVEPSAPVRADVGTFDGAAAVVAVVSTDTGRFAYVVPPGCDAAQPTALAGPVRLG